MKNIFRFMTMFFIVILTVVYGNAQKTSTSPPAKLLASIPFRMLTGGIIIIPAQFEASSDTLNFILDTGSGGISLDSTTAEFLNLKRSSSSRKIRGIGGMKSVNFIYNHSLKIGGLTIDSLDFHINDYELLSSVYGIKIDGIVGYSFLKRYIVSLNYDKYEMDIYSQGVFKYPKNGFFLHPIFSTLPMQSVTVNDQRKMESYYYFDIGAGLCMLFSDKFASDSGLLTNKYKQYPIQVEGIAGKQTMNLTVINEVHIGKFKFRKVPVYIFEDDFNITTYPKLGGLLGNEIMRRFNIVLNYSKQSIYIKPNKHYNDLFDYTYTGLSIYVKNERIIVGDVIKNSPADIAGFKKEDMIVSVGENFSGNIQEYKIALQNIKETNVVVMRDDKVHVLTLKPKNILEKK